MRNKTSKIAFTTLALLLLVSGSVAPTFSTNPSGVGFVADIFIQSDYPCSEPAPIASSIAPNDEYLDKQWALAKIQAPDAWQITSGGQDILIAVLDTGIDQTHIDLAGKVIANINFTQSPTVDDVNGHGTHIAGIIGAIANNSSGIAGLAYSCSLMNVKVADDIGFCNAEEVAKGIIWAVDNGAKVINMSLTFVKPNQALEDAVNYAWRKGAVLVCAAGNDGGSTPVYPASSANCLAITSTNSDDLLGQLAKHGDWVDVAAPGVNIYSTLPDNSFGYKSGTSMAAAYIAGVAGLLFSVASDTNGNGLLNDEVRNMIESSCDEIGTLDIAKGRVNALRAVRQAISLPP